MGTQEKSQARVIMPIVDFTKFDAGKDLLLGSEAQTERLGHYLNYAHGQQDLFLWARGVLKWDVYSTSFNTYGVKLQVTPATAKAVVAFEVKVREMMAKHPKTYNGGIHTWNSHVKKDDEGNYVLSFTISDRVRGQGLIDTVMATQPLQDMVKTIPLSDVVRGSEATVVVRPRWIYKIIEKSTTSGNPAVGFGITFDVRRIIVHKLGEPAESGGNTDAIAANELANWMPSSQQKKM